MQLVEISEQYKDSFAEAMDEMRAIHDMIFWEEVGSPDTLEEYIQIKLDHARGKNLPEGWIPATTFWLIDDNAFVGQANIRHEMTPQLRIEGGHIGYWIRPSKRQQGYGKAILKLALPEAKKLGIDRVLVSCDETNIGSKKIIESNGGVLEKAQFLGEGRPLKLLYWFDLKQ